MNTNRKRTSCGLDIGFTEDLEESVQRAHQNGYDFICTRIVKEGCEPFSTAKLDEKIGGITKTSYLFNSHEWSSVVVGKLSHSTDLTSPIDRRRQSASQALLQELKFSAFLSLPAVIVEVKDDNCSGLARLIYSFLHQGHHHLHIWVKIPLQSSDGQQDTWQWWNKFRKLCNYHTRIGLALEITSDLPTQLERWPGEPVRIIYLSTSVFLTNKKGFPVLSRPHQQIVGRLLRLNCQAVITGPNVNEDSIIVYHQYLTHLCQASNMECQYDKFAKGYEDYLQAPLQPLMDNLESSTYEIFEKDPVKYAMYEEAVYRCLLDTIPEDERSTVTAVIMVLGAGRGPLVRMSLRGAARAQRKVKLYAVEKNRNAAVLLEHLRVTEWKNNDVTVVSADMRYWEAPEQADIIVSELLGSFSDNELSPECLDGATRFLKPDAICIPQSYTSYLSPISSQKLYNEVCGVVNADRNKPAESSFETPYVVRIHNYHELANAVPLFTFNHPNWNNDTENPKPEFFDEVTVKEWKRKFDQDGADTKMEINGIENIEKTNEDTENSTDVTVPKVIHANGLLPVVKNNNHNSRYRRASFNIPFNTMLHGFAGYFRCALYRDVEISIEPKTHSPGMFSWFPIFFPIQHPIPLKEGCNLKVDFWRCTNEEKVWYEWCVDSPQASCLHNPNGRSYTIGL